MSEYPRRPGTGVRVAPFLALVSEDLMFEWPRRRPVRVAPALASLSCLSIASTVVMF